ncbi:hypothetical protein RUM43_013445 [Polyplax serrata]|uniref:Uncharacterized protein n=1 Tax=Polyplax serrata TaxID=468196 RepID=A0AAN8PHJ7_POLSC
MTFSKGFLCPMENHNFCHLNTWAETEIKGVFVNEGPERKLKCWQGEMGKEKKEKSLTEGKAVYKSETRVTVKQGD